ncbi:MAG: RNA methyltransferase [Bryobacteraceae bacterium]
MAAPTQLDRLRVVLVATRNPLNIGAAARAISNFGFRRLRLVRPFEPSFREARSAVGAADILAKAEVFDTVAEAVADCALVVGTTAVRHRNIHHTLRRLEAGARLIRKRLAGANVALLFGSEKFGLSNEDLSHCHWLVRIPTHERNISMNLGQAVAVCLYELIRDAAAARKVEREPTANSQELERITLRLLETLRATGYLDRRRIADVEDRMRRMIRRLHLPARDAIVWLGIFRQILWKLGQAEPPQD